jgi:hypothetical protein
MPFTFSANTIISITVLTIGLIGLEYTASVVLAILRGLTTTRRLLVFFATSVALTLLFQRFVRIGSADDDDDDDSECDEIEASLNPDDLLDEDIGSECNPFIDDQLVSRTYKGHSRDYSRGTRSRAPRWVGQFYFTLAHINCSG